MLGGLDDHAVTRRQRGRQAAPGRLLVSWGVDEVLRPPDLTSLRAAIKAGEVCALGEMTAQYAGLTLGDPQFEPYLALAEELGLPVGVHTGLGPPGTPYRGQPRFRVALGDPRLLEDLLVRHPKLRLYFMHAGWPYLEPTLAMLYMYPQLHADLSVIDWVLPRAEFHAYLERLVRAGFGRRLMYGSDQMVWREAIDASVEAIRTAPFLTEEQKRDIFHDNAARFFDGVCGIKAPGERQAP